MEVIAATCSFQGRPNEILILVSCHRRCLQRPNLCRFVRSKAHSDIVPIQVMKENRHPRVIQIVTVLLSKT